MSMDMHENFIQRLRLIDYDDIFIICCLSKHMTITQMTKIFRRDMSSLAKKVRRIRRIFGDDYFTKSDKRATILTDKGMELGAACCRFMDEIVKSESFEHKKP